MAKNFQVGDAVHYRTYNDRVGIAVIEKIEGKSAVLTYTIHTKTETKTRHTVRFLDKLFESPDECLMHIREIRGEMGIATRRINGELFKVKI